MNFKENMNALSAEVKAALPTHRVYLEQDVKQPERNVCAIRRMSAQNNGELNARYYRDNAVFRFVLYADSGLQAQLDAESIATRFYHNRKLGTLQLGAISFSESFETETAGVHAIIGMLAASEISKTTLAPGTKLAQVNTKGSVN